MVLSVIEDKKNVDSKLYRKKYPLQNPIHFCLTLICLCALLHEANRSIVKRKIATLVYTFWLGFHGDSITEPWLDYI